ncbi:IMV membrane protein A30, partial [Monkeypox virus]
MEDLNEA